MNNINLFAFLLAVANIQIMQSSGEPIKNLAVKLGNLHSLKNELESTPGFELEKFKNTGFYRVGKIGRYVSKNLRDYMNDGSGHPNDEGIILTIYYGEESDATEQVDNSILLRGVTAAHEGKSQLNEYFERRRSKGKGRSLVDMMSHLSV